MLIGQILPFRLVISRGHILKSCTRLCHHLGMTNAQRSDEGGFPFAFDLGDRLDKAMRVAGLTIDDMAEALDVSRGTIGNYRSGRTTPSKLQIKEWAMRTGAPLAWLETGMEPQDRPVNGLKQDVFEGITTAPIDIFTREPVDDVA